MSANLDLVLSKFKALNLPVTKHPSGHLAPCPDRVDDHRSLLFGEDEHGGVWFKDKAGKSTTESILTALNLDREVLKGTNGNGHNGAAPQAQF